MSLTPDLAYQYNLKVNQGAYILPSTDGQPSILPDSPAQKAGLQEKDVITKVNNLTIDDKTNLVNALGQFKVEETVTLSVFRDGKTITLKVTLAAAPQS